MSTTSNNKAWEPGSRTAFRISILFWLYVWAGAFYAAWDDLPEQDIISMSVAVIETMGPSLAVT